MKKIGAEMILSYALVKRKTLDVSTLNVFCEKLREQIKDVLLEVTKEDISNAVETNPHKFDFKLNKTSFVIKRVKSRRKVNPFDLNHLKRCYSPFYEKEDFLKITKILLEE